MKKYLEDKQRSKRENEDEVQEKHKAKDGYKWVKTDSECKFILSFLASLTGTKKWHGINGIHVSHCRYCSRDLNLPQSSLQF